MCIHMQLACINDHKLKTVRVHLWQHTCCTHRGCSPQGGTAPPPLVLDREAAALMPPRDGATRALLTAPPPPAASDSVKALLADIERNEGVDAILAVRVGTCSA
jgi:hypothetical protein